MQLLLYFAICLGATVIGAVCGIGGGVIIRPVMDALSGLSVSAISFLSGFTVLCMSISSLFFSKHRGVKIDVQRTLPLGIGAAIGGVAGKLLFDLIRAHVSDAAAVGLVQNAVLACLTIGTVLYMWKKAKIRTHDIHNIPVILGIGFVLGLLSSFLGIGGGPFNLIVLFFCFSMDSKTAALNSLCMIFISQTASMLSTVVQNRIPSVEWSILLIMGASGVIGGVLGRKWAAHLSNRHTDKLFFVLLYVIIMICIYNMIHYASLI